MNRKYQMDSQKKRNRKTIIVIIIICLLLALASLKVIFFPKIILDEKVYAGIGGAVIDGGVYQIFDDTRIYELILSAKGLHKRADISHLNVDEKVIPWEVYCIPFLPKQKFRQIRPPKIEVPPVEETKLDVRQATTRINFVYAGLPRTYLFISVYPDLNYITTTHIPWFTLATAEFEYPRTLYEVYLTGGIPFLLRGVQMITGETIDHYFTHNRPSWINFINYLDGVEIDVPEDFAHEYHIQPGVQTINGLLAWEFIRYISKHSRRNDRWITGSRHRISMQQEFMEALYKKFKTMNVMNQGAVVKKIISDAETDMKLDDVIKIAFDINQLQGTSKDFLTLPGVLQEFDGRIMLVPNLTDFQVKERKFLFEQHSKSLGFKDDTTGGKIGGFGGKK